MLLKIFNNKEFADIKFIIDDGIFYANKIIFPEESDILNDINEGLYDIVDKMYNIRIENIRLEIFTEIMNKLHEVTPDIDIIASAINHDALFDCIDYFKLKLFKEELIYFFISENIFTDITENIANHVSEYVTTNHIFRKFVNKLSFDMYRIFIDSFDVNTIITPTGNNVMHSLVMNGDISKLKYAMNRDELLKLMSVSHENGSTPYQFIYKYFTLSEINDINNLTQGILFNNNMKMNYEILSFSMVNITPDAYNVFMNTLAIVPNEINMYHNQAKYIVKNIKSIKIAKTLFTINTSLLSKSIIRSIINANIDNHEFIMELIITFRDVYKKISKKIPRKLRKLFGKCAELVDSIESSPDEESNEKVINESLTDIISSFSYSENFEKAIQILSKERNIDPIRIITLLNEIDNT